MFVQYLLGMIVIISVLRLSIMITLQDKKNENHLTKVSNDDKLKYQMMIKEQIG